MGCNARCSPSGLLYRMRLLGRGRRRRSSLGDWGGCGASRDGCVTSNGCGSGSNAKAGAMAAAAPEAKVVPPPSAPPATAADQVAAWAR